MSRVLICPSVEAYQSLDKCSDPIVLDSREKKDEKLKALLGHDYKWYREFTVEKVEQIAKRADKFNRDVLVVFKDKIRGKEIGGLVQNELKRISKRTDASLQGK